MSSFADKDSLCNAALSLLGEPPATPFTGGTTVRDSTCALHYPQALAKILTEHRWDFATTLHALEIADPQPSPCPFDYPIAYPLPEDCMRILSIRHKNGARIEDFRKLGTTIFLDAEYQTGDIHLEYLADDPSPSAMPHAFADCVVHLLAARLATHLLQNPNATEQHLAHYREALSRAATTETRETQSNENFTILHFAQQSGSHLARFES